MAFFFIASDTAPYVTSSRRLRTGVASVRGADAPQEKKDLHCGGKKDLRASEL